MKLEANINSEITLTYGGAFSSVQSPLLTPSRTQKTDIKKPEKKSLFSRFLTCSSLVKRLLNQLLKDGVISKQVVYQAKQNLCDHQSAIIQSQFGEGTSTKEQLFQSEQSLRDRKRSIPRNQVKGNRQRATGNRDGLGWGFNPNLSEHLIEGGASNPVHSGGEKGNSSLHCSLPSSQFPVACFCELQQAIAQSARLQAELTQREAEGRKIQLESQQQIQQLEVDITQLKVKNSDKKLKAKLNRLSS